MADDKLVRDKLQERLDQAESIIEALRTGKIDAIVSQKSVALLRLKEAEAQLRRSEARYRAMVDQSPDAIAVHADGKYVYVNAAAVRLFGATQPDEIIGCDVLTLTHPDDREAVATRMRLSAQEGRITPVRAFRVVRLDGEPVDVETTGSPIEFQDRPAVQVVLRDITDRKRMEEELRKSRDDLEQRVRERTAELELRNQELQNFTFAASHDLQEPLRKLQTFGDLLVTKYADSIDEQGRDYLRRMGETAARMRVRLYSLLEYSRLTSKAEPFTRIKLNEIVKTVLSDLEVPIKEANASVEIGALPEIEAHAGQMASLFQNLLENALKFRRKGEPPRVRIHSNYKSSEEPRAGEWEIYVEDNGIGFEEAYLDLIFKPFQRLHGRTEYVGVGMGLAICRKVAERHGGTITARSTPGQGSTFIVRLPKNQ